MNITNALAGIMTQDITTASIWYEELFNRPADVTPMEGLSEWHFQESGVLQIVQDEKRAGASSVTLTVTSRENVLSELESKGISVGQMTETEFVKTVTISDPEGNRITFAENLG